MECGAGWGRRYQPHRPLDWPRQFRRAHCLRSVGMRDLVVAPTPSRPSEYQVDVALAALAGLSDRVRFLGGVPDADLPALYNLALVYEKVDAKESISLWERYIALAGPLPSEKDWVDVARLHRLRLGRAAVVLQELRLEAGLEERGCRSAENAASSCFPRRDPRAGDGHQRVAQRDRHL